jgi:hypothetical protein
MLKSANSSVKLRNGADCKSHSGFENIQYVANISAYKTRQESLSARSRRSGLKMRVKVN